MSRNRPHGDHQFAFQPASFTAGAIGSVHRHIAIFADMADINACLHQWCFECEAAANQKSDQVRVALPDFRASVTSLASSPSRHTR
jgi:hypothetical protein